MTLPEPLLVPLLAAGRQQLELGFELELMLEPMLEPLPLPWPLPRPGPMTMPMPLPPLEPELEPTPGLGLGLALQLVPKTELSRLASTSLGQAVAAALGKIPPNLVSTAVPEY